jgi:hypothetical protein
MNIIKRTKLNLCFIYALENWDTKETEMLKI